MYTVYVYCKQRAPVQIHYVYMLYNITLRFVCSLCLVGSVDVLGAERCGGDHSVLHGSGLAFGPGVQCRPADRHGTDALHSSLWPPPPHTHTYIVEVSSTWPLDLALWVAEDRNLKGIENGLTCLSFSASFLFFISQTLERLWVWNLSIFRLPVCWIEFQNVSVQKQKSPFPIFYYRNVIHSPEKKEISSVFLN